MVGGVENDHSLELHQVTGCMHAPAASRRGGAKVGGADAGARMAQMATQQLQQDAQFSLASWIRKVLDGGRNLLKSIWGTNEVNALGTMGDQSGNARLMAQVGDSRAAGDPAAGGVPAAVNGLKAAEQSAAIQGNPYFAAMPDRSAHMTPIRRLRAKVVEGAEKLAGRLSGKAFRFRAKNSFQAKSQQRSREDMRKRSKYKKDELEIDCVLTDESYLMDSYGRKGEYRQLTTRK